MNARFKFVVLVFAVLFCVACSGGKKRLAHLKRNVISDADWRLTASGPGLNIPPPPVGEKKEPETPKTRPVVAVFDLRSKGANVSQEILARMSDYLAAQIVAAGRYQVVPRDQLLKRLRGQKKKSYKRCFDQSCQIEIGKEMAAQKSLSSAISRLGSRCVVTAMIYDLRKATSEAGASARGPCNEDGIVRSIDKVVRRLSQGR